MSGTGFIRPVIARRIRTTHGVSTVEFFYCLAEAFLGLEKAALGVGIVVVDLWWWREEWFGEGRHFLLCFEGEREGERSGSDVEWEEMKCSLLKCFL